MTNSNAVQGSDARTSNRRSTVFPREVSDVEAFGLGIIEDDSTADSEERDDD